jgi:DNA (cytosine-5)-methyltransferase 1
LRDQQERLLISQLLEIYDPGSIAKLLTALGYNTWCRESINRWTSGNAGRRLSDKECEYLQTLLPKPLSSSRHEFRFIDLFAGIGGIRRGFDEIGGQCVFTSEWNNYSVRTYKANYYNDPDTHVFNNDIREVTLSGQHDVSEEEAYSTIDNIIPNHDVLLAGFPCQPFSIAGVSKKNSLGRAHGFECKTQGTLFFDVARIIKAKQPAAFLLENVKNLKSHDQGRTLNIILETLDELGYAVADVNYQGNQDPKIIDAVNFLPQHRERIVLAGFRREPGVHKDFTLRNIAQYYPQQIPSFGDILEPEDKVDSKYILSPELWQYLYNYAAKHKAKGNGFGYGLTGENDVARTLSARYYKDGSEILVDRGWNLDAGFDDPVNQHHRPRRLTPTECSRLMGFDDPGESAFRIPVSDTQAYKQFGNSVVVPVFRAIAQLMKPVILKAMARIAAKTTAAA